MQSLWSRAGQAHRCGCRACETAINTLSRRSSTAVRRRKPTFAEVFTACYSSMLATATVIDAFRKEDRRQELDRQLDDARRDLAEVRQLVADETSRLHESSDKLSLNQMDEIWTCLKDINTELLRKETLSPLRVAGRPILSQLLRDHYQCVEPAAAKQQLKETASSNFERLENEILAEEIDPSIIPRLPKSRKQLHNETSTVRKVIRQLLARAGKQKEGSQKDPSFVEAFQMVNSKRDWYSMGLLDSRRARQTTCVLNSRLREIINSPDLSLREMVGRVCYNLMVSPYPPDMHTYNTLIVAFDKLGHSELAEPLVNSFYYYRRLRPTPITFDIILNHYEKSRDLDGFLRTLQCITGIDSETGAKVARRHVEDIKQSQVSSEWLEPGCWKTQTGDYVYAHAPITPSMVQTIVRGLLSFRLVEQAAMVLLSCVNANISLGTDTIKHTLNETIRLLDWRAAVRLVRGLTEFGDSWPSVMLDGEEIEASYIVDRLYVLLDMCGLRTQGHAASESTLENLEISKTKFDHFLDGLSKASSVLQLDAPTSQSTLGQLSLNSLEASKHKSRMIQWESIGREVELAMRTTKLLEYKLLDESLDSERQFSTAMMLGREATLKSLKLHREFTRHFVQGSKGKAIHHALWYKCKLFRTSMRSYLEMDDPGAKSLKPKEKVEEQAEVVPSKPTPSAAWAYQPPLLPVSRFLQALPPKFFITSPPDQSHHQHVQSRGIMEMKQG